MGKFRLVRFIATIFLFMWSISFAVAWKPNLSDSLRVLCVKYDNCGSGIDGQVTVSAFLECDSTKVPAYMLGDSLVYFFSGVKIDAVKNITFLHGKALGKKLQKSFPNGLLVMNLKEGEDFNSCQLLPDGDNLSRKAFLTKFELGDFDNSTGELSTRIKNYVEEYGTDDEAFRLATSYDQRNTTPILILDSLENISFVRNFTDIKEGAIADMAVFTAEEAEKFLKTKGVNGLVLVTLKSEFTVRQAVKGAIEKIADRIRLIENTDLVIMQIRKPILLNN